MKKIVVFYSYTGNTKKLAEAKAKEKQAELLEVGKDIKPSRFMAYVAGSFGALRKKQEKIENITDKLNLYDEIIIMGPIWAGAPAPVVNSILASLPAKKQVSIFLVSGSGKSKCKDYIESYIHNKSCKLEKYQDMRS